MLIAFPSAPPREPIDCACHRELARRGVEIMAASPAEPVPGVVEIEWRVRRRQTHALNILHRDGRIARAIMEHHRRLRLIVEQVSDQPTIEARRGLQPLRLRGAHPCNGAAITEAGYVDRLR